MPDARNLATFTQQLAANLTEGDKGKSETLLEQIQTILDEYKRPLPSQENTLSFLPQAIGKKVEKALEEYGLPLRYNPYLTNFSKKGAEFATFGQLKVLLEEVNFTLH